MRRGQTWPWSAWRTYWDRCFGSWTVKHWGFRVYRLGTTPPYPPQVHLPSPPCYSGLSVVLGPAQRLRLSVKTVITGSPTYHDAPREELDHESGHSVYAWSSGRVSLG